MTDKEFELFVLACKESCRKNRCHESGWNRRKIIEDLVKNLSFQIDEEYINKAIILCVGLY